VVRQQSKALLFGIAVGNTVTTFALVLSQQIPSGKIFYLLRKVGFWRCTSGGRGARSTTSWNIVCLKTDGESSILAIEGVVEFFEEKIKGLNTKRSNNKGQKMGFFNGQ
jgi:hypothetical protein